MAGNNANKSINNSQNTNNGKVMTKYDRKVAKRKEEEKRKRPCQQLTGAYVTERKDNIQGCNSWYYCRYPYSSSGYMRYEIL